MLNNYYRNSFNVYRPSGSLSDAGDYVETGSLYLNGIGRLEPIGGIENESKYNFYCDVIDISVEDTLHIDDKIYNVKNIRNYRNHHLQIKLEYITH